MKLEKEQAEIGTELNIYIYKKITFSTVNDVQCPGKTVSWDYSPEYLCSLKSITAWMFHSPQWCPPGQTGVTEKLKPESDKKVQITGPGNHQCWRHYLDTWGHSLYIGG